MLLQVILEGLGLGTLLVLVCAVGICKGAVGMVHLYSPAVQQRCVKLGLTSQERIRRNSLLFKAVCVPGYISYVLVFDAANRTAVKMIAKTWLRTAKIKDVGAYFAVSDAPKEIGEWDNRLQVTSRGYMLGYNDLRDPSVSGFFRFLARVGDNGMKMQIVKIEFGGKQ